MKNFEIDFEKRGSGTGELHISKIVFFNVLRKSLSNFSDNGKLLSINPDWGIQAG